VDALPRLLGERDDPDAFRPVHPLLRALHRRFAGLRFGRTDAVVEALLPAVVEQKVTGFEARASYRALLRSFGERAPGPVPMIVPPDPVRLAGMPYHAFHPLGLEARRARTITRVAATAERLEGASRLAPAEALERLCQVRGVGAWTAAEAARTAFGDPDAVSLGDYHVPSLVCWALGGMSGDETRMLEWLEPYRGQRARVVRLIELSGLRPPRRGPRLPPRSIARM
jgi:3-methyladenine DNA glycosylase/8-oxoguanine DNA glycosylase